MGRRNRYINMAHLGAFKAFDLRFENYSDNASISSLTDRAGISNASQATSGKRPTFKANIVNGNPVARFDGVDDTIGWSGQLFTSSGMTIAAVWSTTATDVPLLTSNRNFSVPTTTYNNQALRNSSGKHLVYIPETVYAPSNGTTFTSPLISVISCGNNTVMEFFDNGASKGATASTATVTNYFYNNLGQITTASTDYGYCAGDIGALALFPFDIRSSPLRKRIEHSLAYSFKIAI